MRVLIAGCGDIGTQVGIQLHQKGHQVFGLKRHVSSLPGEITAIAADLSQSIDSSILPANIEQVIYILAASGFSEQAYQQAYVDGVKNLTDALGENTDRLKRFIFVSSTSVYGQNAGEWVDERSITLPQSFNGQIMLEAEQQVLTLPNSLVVRFSGIYGPGRNWMLNQVKSAQLAAKEPVIYTNRIHREDCVRVLTYFSEMSDLQHQIVLASDHQPVSMHTIQRWLADQLDVPEDKRKYQTPKRRAGSKRISNQRLIEWGYSFKFPDYRAGYQHILSCNKN